MIDHQQIKTVAREIAAARAALTQARDALRLERAAMDDPEARAKLMPDYRTTRKLQARLEAERTVRPLKDAALSQAQAIAALRGELADRSLAALTARLVPAVKPFKPGALMPGLSPSEKDQYRDRHDTRAMLTDVENAIAQMTMTLRVPQASPAALAHLTEHAAATGNLWLLGLIADTVREKKGDEYFRLRIRTQEAIDALPLPAEQAEALATLDQIAADAEAINELYVQIADPSADLSAATGAEFVEGIRALDADGQPDAGRRYATEREQQRRERARQAADQARKEIRRVGTGKPPESVPAPVPEPAAPPSGEPDE